MPEAPGLYLRLSVMENLQCFADLYEVPDPDDRIRTARVGGGGTQPRASSAVHAGNPRALPASVAADAVVGERQQGTLEPVLTTPVRREELLLGKALAALVPSVAIACAVYACFLACVGPFARPAVSSALIKGPDLLAQLLFTPLLAGWSIWVGIARSSTAND